MEINISFGDLFVGIGALCAGASSVYTALKGKKVASTIQEVKVEVTQVLQQLDTGNQKSMGQLAAAIESVRIGMIPPTQRNTDEKRHLLDVPERKEGGST